MSLSGGSTPAIGASIARVTTPHATGSDVARNGNARGDNIDAVASSRVADATQNAIWRDSLYGSLSGINGGLANAASFQNGLYESQSLPPSGVNGTGATAKSDGAGGGAGAQNTTSTNPNNGGLSPAQVQALNQQNKLSPELLASLLAEKTNKTNDRRDEGLKKSNPTADPLLNEALKDLGTSLQEKIKEFDKELDKALKANGIDTKEKFQEEFKNGGFDSAEDLKKFTAEMQKDLDKGYFEKDGFNQEKLDKFNKFLDSIPDKESYKDLKAKGEEVSDKYQKGLDIQTKDIVAGNFRTAANDILDGFKSVKGDLPDEQSYLKSFLEQAPGVQKNEKGEVQYDDKGQPKFDDSPEGQKAEEFYNKAQDTVEKARDMFNDPEVGAKEMEEFLQSGEFNEAITDMKKLYNGTEDEPGFGAKLKEGLQEGDTNFAETTMNNMMFMKASSPFSESSEKMEQGLDEIIQENNGKPVTAEDVFKNEALQEHFQEYYDEAFKDLPEGENKYIPPTENDSSSDTNYGPSAVVMRTEESASDAINSLDTSVAFADDVDDLDLELDDPSEDLDLDLDLDDVEYA